ncbi:MAG: efflux transporter outer membrane subunit [Rhodothermales bacterium]
MIDKRYLPRILAVCLCAWGLAGCTFAPHVRQPEAVQEMPARFERSMEEGSATPARWWHGFNDPVLNQLVDTALVSNLDLRVAAARVNEVQNQYRIARAPLLPGVQATLDRTQQSTPANTGPTGDIAANIPQFPDRFDVTTYSASLGFAYELDFWGRVRGAKNAALREFFASRSDAQTTQIGVIAETIATYFEIDELERSLALARQNVDLLTERAELTRQRYERGLISSFELYAIQQTFEEARSNLPVLESRLHEAQGRLNVLLGRYAAPRDTLAASAQATAFNLEPIPAGLPSDLLRQRPDVMAAAQRLEAARQRIGVARAEQFPQFSLTASGGTQSRELSDLVQTGQRFWLFGGSLTAPLFNAGALRANVRVAWARYEQQAARYEKTVLTAFKEVEVALMAYQKQQERYAFLQEELEAAWDNAEAQQRRFVRGIGDYLAYLDARRNLVRVQTSVASAQRALAGARLAVHRALGGAWIEDDAGEVL